MIVLKRLEDYINERKIPRIDFLKIDIEGHELFALKVFGKYLSDKFITTIQFEYGGANLDSHTSLMEIYDLLKKEDSKYLKLCQNILKKSNIIPIWIIFSIQITLQLAKNLYVIEFKIAFELYFL